MASFIPKSLASGTVPAAPTVIYVAPAGSGDGASAQIRAIDWTNVASGGVTVTLWKVPSGTSGLGALGTAWNSGSGTPASSLVYVWNNATILPLPSDPDSRFLILNAGDGLVAVAGAAGSLNYQISGAEEVY